MFESFLSPREHGKVTTIVTAGINVTSETNFFFLVLFSEVIVKRRAQECVYSRKKRKSLILESVSASQVPSFCATELALSDET